MKVGDDFPWLQALAVKLGKVFRYSVFRKWFFWLKGKRLHWAVYITTVSLLVGAVMGLLAYRQSFFQVVLVDGREIGLVRESQEVEEFVGSLVEKCTLLYRMPVTPLQEVVCCREYRPHGTDNLPRVKERLRQQLTMVTGAAMLTVDGQPIVPVRDQGEVESIVELLGDSYAGQSAGNRLLEVKLAEELEGRNAGLGRRIYPAEEAARMLAKECGAREIYTLRGSFAQRYEMQPTDDDGAERRRSYRRCM